MKFEFRGVISAMITPLKNSGREIDEKALRTYCDFLISIPMQSSLDSLNASTAAAVILFEGPSYLMVALLSLVLSAVGIIGDLLESLFKRVSGVKDSGQILPGHGGLLDRCDSLLLTAPVLYYVIIWGHAALFK